MILIKKFSAYLFSFFILISTANANQYNLDLTTLPVGTNLSLLIQSTDTPAKTLIEHRSQQMKQPASTLKLVTTLAALLELGEDFRFTTTLKTDGSIKKNQLDGNLIIQMSGDPTFTRSQLNDMLTVLRMKGIEKIEGDIIIDTSIFTSHDKASGWSWNNLTYCYNTPPSAAIIDGNCFYAGLSPANKVGELAQISVASIYPVTMTSSVITTADNSDDTYCELDIIAKDNNRYQLTGCVKRSAKKRYFQFAVLDGVDYLSAIFKQQLSLQNITFNGQFLEQKQKTTQPLTTLTKVQSAPLSELLTVMLKKSNNLIADTVFRTIGAQYFSMPGSWRNSADAVKIILKEKADIDLQNSLIMDGSGLSRLNLISASTMMEILQYIAHHDQELHIMDMLPIAGVDGTLQYRDSFRDRPFKANIIAKTGYLEGSYNLAGYLKDKSGNYQAFVQFISGYSSPEQDEQLKKIAIMEFESALYRHFLQEVKNQ